ncbi:four-helix bundle copper-binding protein [Arthrobacter agilis]|uniref:four-helix bundle copper-binding protein n=1 Tax=Arthrobacter agilis TaxID=37921 RepID=UPI000B35B695|nr:four-helix bundle copper-binding protein [Arthrobacter agilis]OUM42128.1 hypothetical protein B8W74_08390 [Arthrobacter agilis]PPB45472.1 four-helix bundle copper-binding protein [Arthrobacter agilis]TPV26552.1 four-helix bundle copper-binding protein [Arthrobacter agilis]VDR33535.1 Uncharacterised protein [Arthrobacter agilis]
MSRTQQMTTTHPRTDGTPSQDRRRIAAISALLECAQVCSVCADACLADDDLPHLIACVRRNQDCADLCRVTAAILLRRTEPHDAVIQKLALTCRLACSASALECTDHENPHCTLCTKACREAERALTELLEASAAPGQ